MEIYQKVIATLRSLYHFYQTAHWVSKGSQYYGDHLLLQRLYEATNLDIDLVGEKALGITKSDASVDLKENITLMGKIIHNLEDNHFNSALKLEKAFVKLCDEQAKNPQNSEGVKNMFAGLADKHEGHCYLLQQRVNA